MGQWFCLSHGLGDWGSPGAKFSFFSAARSCVGPSLVGLGCWVLLALLLDLLRVHSCASCRAVNPLKDVFLLFPEVLPGSFAPRGVDWKLAENLGSVKGRRRWGGSSKEPNFGCSLLTSGASSVSVTENPLVHVSTTSKPESV